MMSSISFLAPIKSRILEAYASAIPEQQEVLQQIKEALDNVDLDNRRESFAAIPGYKVVTVGWWAVEVIWCLSYCFEAWKKPLQQAMETQKSEVFLDHNEVGVIGLGLFDSAIDAVSVLDRMVWLHSNVGDFPYDADGEAFDDLVKDGENIFLGAIGWILLHEMAHLHHNHGNMSNVVVEEREADSTATNWLFNRAPFGTADDRAMGLACALLYMWMREDKATVPDKDHPPVTDRIERCINDAGLISNAWVLCIFAALMDIYEQRHGNRTKALDRNNFSTCREYIEAHLQRRRERQQAC